VARACGLREPDAEMGANLLNWALGVAFVYSALFAIGAVLLGTWAGAALYTLSAVVCGGLMFWNLNRTKWAGLAETDE
jgi:hypothetical protein